MDYKFKAKVSGGDVMFGQDIHQALVVFVAAIAAGSQVAPIGLHRRLWPVVDMFWAPTRPASR